MGPEPYVLAGPCLSPDRGGTPPVTGGTPALFGNHVVIDHGEGSFSAYAHLRRKSVRVDVRQQVSVGEVLGEVLGEVGNSSEPHLHFQLMDRPRATQAAGLPFRWRDIEIRPGETDPTRSVKPVSETIEDGLPTAGRFSTPGLGTS